MRPESKWGALRVQLRLGVHADAALLQNMTARERSQVWEDDTVVKKPSEVAPMALADVAAARAKALLRVPVSPYELDAAVSSALAATPSKTPAREAAPATPQAPAAAGAFAVASVDAKGLRVRLTRADAGGGGGGGETVTPPAKRAKKNSGAAAGAEAGEAAEVGPSAGHFAVVGSDEGALKVRLRRAEA